MLFINKPSPFPCPFPSNLPIETQLRGGWLDQLGFKGLVSGIGERGGAEKTAFVPFFPGGVTSLQLQARTEPGRARAPSGPPGRRARHRGNGEQAAATHVSARRSPAPSIRPSPGVRKLVQLANPGWQPRVTQWFFSPLRSYPCETSAASAGIHPPKPHPGGEEAWQPAAGLLVARRGRQRALRPWDRAGRLPAPRPRLLPAPAAPVSAAPAGRGRAGESPWAHLCRKR